MQKKPETITVSEFLNNVTAPSPKFPRGEAIYKYRVEKLKNLTTPHLGNNLSETEVQDLINSGIDVTVLSRKD